MLTFKCNRGGEDFKSILRENGFKESENNEHIDFSFWDTYSREKVDSKIMLNDLNLIMSIDNKKYLYKTIEKLKLTHHVPKTFINISNLTNDDLDNNKLYFFKLVYGSGGKDVHPIKSIKDIDNILKEKQDKNKKNINYYLIQEEVPNMYLHQGKYKTTLRNFVLVCDTGIFFYKDGFISHQKFEYDKNSLDNRIHLVLTQRDKNKLSDHYNYDKILPQLINICSELLIPYFKDISFNNQYYILGLDFIIDKDYKPYLIEINPMPNLIFSGPGCIKKNMLNDFIKFYVLPKLTDKEPEIGGWLKIK